MADGTHKTELQTLQIKILGRRGELEKIETNVNTLNDAFLDAVQKGKQALSDHFEDQLTGALASRDQLKNELKNLEQELLVLEHSSKDIAECIEHSLSLYEQIKENPEDQDFRLKVNAELRRIIDHIKFFAYKDPIKEEVDPLATIFFKNGAVRWFVYPDEEAQHPQPVENAPEGFLFEGDDWSGALVYRDPKLGLVPVELYDLDKSGNLVRND